MNEQTRAVAIYEPVVETRGLGPAMLAILPQQRAFVYALVETGGQDNTKAAALAGYGGTPGSTRVQAHRLAHDPKVLDAIREVADERLRSGAILGAEVLIEIAKDPTHKDRFRSAVELMNRAGMLVATRIEHRVVHQHDDAALIARVQELAKTLDMDPKLLLGSAGVITDAEFEVVAPQPPAAAAASNEGWAYIPEEDAA